MKTWQIAMLALVGAFVFSQSEGVYEASAMLPVELDPWYRYDDIFKKYGAMYSVPWQWLKAIALNESSLGADWRVQIGSVSSDGLSYGLMQVTVKTGEALDAACTPDKLNDPDYSVRLASMLVAQLVSQFKGDMESVVRAYNGGPRAAITKSVATDPYWERFQRNLTKVNERE